MKASFPLPAALVLYRGISVYHPEEQTLDHITHQEDDPNSLADNKARYRQSNVQESTRRLVFFLTLLFMKLTTFYCIVLVFTLPSLIIPNAWGQSENETYALSDIRVRDPFILADTATHTYYLYAQRANRLGDETTQQGVEVYTSSDLQAWSGPQPVFIVPDTFWAQQMVWAPEVHAYQGKYYLFVTLTAYDTLPAPPGERKGPTQWKRGTQVLVADVPLGPFRPFANRPHTPVDWMALDGTLFVEDNVPWMVFCHEWVQTHNGTLEAIQLTSDLSATVGEPTTLFQASKAPWARSMKELGLNYDGYVTDGPWFYRTRGGALLMLWSSFGDQRYAIGMARSASGRVLGPWKQLPEPLFPQDGGHGMIFRTFEGKQVLVFHQPNQSPQERARLYEVAEQGGKLVLSDPALK